MIDLIEFPLAQGGALQNPLALIISSAKIKMADMKKLPYFLLVAIFSAEAADWPMPGILDDVVGESYAVPVAQGETLLDIAIAHDIGQEAILHANQDVDRWLPQVGEDVVIPAAHILPRAPREGIVLNLPEMRIYYYTKDRVYSYPTGIGRYDWKTPLGSTKVVSKQKDPSWTPTESSHAEARAEGRELPAVVPPGPDNPLGAYALRLALPSYLIHGTHKPMGVGMRVSHGCVRLLPDDIEQLFGLVPVGAKVEIVNQPVKVGWHGDVLYLEVHPPLAEHAEANEDLMRYALEVIYQELEKRPAKLIGHRVKDAIENKTGMPTAISGNLWEFGDAGQLMQ